MRQIKINLCTFIFGEKISIQYPLIYEQPPPPILQQISFFFIHTAIKSLKEVDTGEYCIKSSYSKRPFVNTNTRGTELYVNTG